MDFVEEKARKIPIIAEVDVVVAGGGPAGVGAAIAAARNKAKTIVVEQYGCLGGIGTSGLHTHMDTLTSEGNINEILGGIPMEISKKAIERSIAVRNGGKLDYELEGMKRILDDFVLESGSNILYNTFVSGVMVDGGRVTGIIVENKTGRGAIKAKYTVDCTGDADVAARAGVPFELGRKSDGKVQPVTLMFRIGGCDTGKVKEYQRVYGWRLNHVWAKAVENGDMEPFNVHVCGFWYTHSRPDQIGVNFTNIPNINGINTDDVTKAQIEGRRQAEVTLKVMNKYIPGCENAYIIDTAAMLGVRETRRINGEFTLTEDELLSTKKFPDGIAKGSFKIDIHTPGAAGQADGRRLPLGGSYDIPYGCLVPKEIENILVAGRCISVTHEALGSVRVMLQCMALGEAAGTAAALCSEFNESPRCLNVGILRKALIDQGVIL